VKIPKADKAMDTTFDESGDALDQAIRALLSQVEKEPVSPTLKDLAAKLTARLRQQAASGHRATEQTD
jgi:hypothetical protein